MQADTVSYATTPKFAKSYWNTLLQLMSLKDGVCYPKDHIFTRSELLQLTPTDVCEFFCLKVYGTTNPDADAKPQYGRSTSLEAYKKNISYYMPNKLVGWNVQLMTGNPTRSAPVNQLIRDVKKAEVRKRGKATLARRPLEFDEFSKLVEMLRGSSDSLKKFGFTALVILQFHFIARVDDTSALMVDEIKAHPTYKDFALRCRLCWSKNVLEERAAPPQIMFGANQFKFCPLLTLALFLELFYPTERNENDELNCFSAINKTADGTKQRVSKFLKQKIFMDKDFLDVQQDQNGDIVGTHSIRKFSTTYARRSGCTLDDINVRGRWKRFKQMVETYVHPEIPYPDAKTAAALSIGGPVKYQVKTESNIDDCWIAEHVLPHTLKMHKDKKAVVTLGKAVLWACFDAEASDIVPLQILQRVRLAYERVQNQLSSTENPVRKVPLLICGHEGQLIIEELADDAGEAPARAAPEHDDNSSAVTPEILNRRRSRHTSEIQAVFAQLMQIRRQNEQLSTEVQVLRSHLSTKIKHLTTAVNRVSRMPAARVTINNSNNSNETNNDTNNDTAVPFNNYQVTGDLLPREKPAQLTKNIRSLYILWNEFEFGLGGSKAAKDYNSRDRGANRFLYSKRKVFWDLVVIMVNRGRQANEAIDNIYSHYGYRTPVSTIIKRLQQERMNRTGYPQFL